MRRSSEAMRAGLLVALFALAACGRRMITSSAFPTTLRAPGDRLFVIRGHRISVVIPCFNEEHGILEVMRRIPPAVDEVVVSDNNSSDRSAEVARTNGAKVVHAPVQGYGAALKMGLANATGDFVVTGHCHGSVCRKAHGAAFAAWGIL